MKAFVLLFLVLRLSSLTAAESESAKLPGTRLPLVSLAVKETIVSDRRVGCSVTLLEESSAVGKLHRGVVRIHGASSQAYPKKSFALTLDAPVSWLGMSNSAHWVLNAAFVD